MSESFEVNVELREDLGKGASRRLRRLENRLPGIVYGGGKAPQPVSLEHAEVVKHLENEAFYSHVLTLKTGKVTQTVVLKDLQRHPFKPKITHMDFMRVNANETFHANVPLHFINEDVCAGFKAGGVITHSITNVEIICLPKDLPEFIAVDMTGLGMDQVLHLSDIVLPKGVSLVELSHGEDHDQAVVSIHKGRAAAASTEGEEETTD